MAAWRRSALPFGAIATFAAISFILLSIRTEEFDVVSVLIGAGIIVLLFAQYYAVPHYLGRVDKPLMICVNMLAVIGLVVLYRLETMTGIKQFMWYFVGLVAMIATIITVNKMEAPEGGIWFFMGVGLGLLVLSLLFGEVIGGAQNWIQLESLGVNFQPSEFVKIALVLAVASVFREKRRQLAYLPAYIFVMLCIVILVLLKDLGAALLYFFVFMVMMYAATGSKIMSFLGIGAFSGASVVAYNIFDHVRVRVQVWINPWATADTGGYQIIHGLIAIVSGGAFGSGLGLGSPRFVPAYTTDYVFSSICEEMGILMGLLMIALYIFITLRGIIIAKNAENSFFSLLALGCTANIAFQTFIILGGVIKFIPLTGITLPLVSYGGSSMIVTMIFVGILQAIALRNSRLEDKNAKEAAT